MSAQASRHCRLPLVNLTQTRLALLPGLALALPSFVAQDTACRPLTRLPAAGPESLGLRAEAELTGGPGPPVWGRRGPPLAPGLALRHLPRHF